MSGHSKWATTKHKKAAIDGKRAKLFAKLIKNIEVAARLGGPDIDGNPTLYDAIQKGRKSSLPSDNIDRAVKRGAGVGQDAVDYQNIMYEVYGPSGVALLVECLTDNKNRAAAEVRLAVTKNGGTMADPGSVSYMFSRKGVIVVSAEGGVTEDTILEAVLEVGVEDIENRGDQFIITTDPSDMVAVRTALQSAGIDYESADSEFVSSMPVQTEVDAARTVLKLIDALEDSDDVQNVYTNFDMSAEVQAQLEAE
jgi:YebC/PmpR family DNA-binding regulatory protein